MTVDQLTRQLSIGDTADRLSAAETLASMGPEAAPAAVELVRACGSESLREASVAALEELGPPPHELLTPLLSLVNDPHPDAAYWAITLIGRLGTDADRALADEINTALVNATAITNEMSVRERAVWALGKRAEVAQPTVPLLENLAADAEYPRLARLAGDALAAIRGR